MSVPLRVQRRILIVSSINSPLNRITIYVCVLNKTTYRHKRRILAQIHFTKRENIGSSKIQKISHISKSTSLRALICKIKSATILLMHVMSKSTPPLLSSQLCGKVRNCFLMKTIILARTQMFSQAH